MTILITIAIVGLLIGIVSNLLPFFGNTFINFALAVVTLGLHEGLKLIGYVGFPIALIVFVQWYFIGTFGIKLISYLPIPLLQPIAQMFKGN